MTDIVILKPRWLLRMVPGEPVLQDHALVMQGDRILEILPFDAVAARYGQAQSIDLSSHVLMPGLINAHSHVPMSLMRGMADDLPLMQWLQQHIWPAEARWVDADWVHAGAMLSLVEAVRAGTTCINDMYFHPEAVARAAVEVGLRATLGITVIDFPTRYATDAPDYLAKGLAARETFAGEPLIDWMLAPHAPYTVSDKSFVMLRDARDRRGLRLHCHVHETREEIQGSLDQHRMRPLARLQQLGLLNDQFTAVHMVHLSEEEMALVAGQGVAVVHNASSNLKLASGISPVPGLLAAGGTVALGSDGAASNNRQDLWTEMRQAALLAKGSTGQADVLPARQVLEMATLHGARAIGRAHELGSLEVGKLADVIAVDLSAPECQPIYHPEAQLVYAAGREHVTDVWVAGQALMRERRLLRVDLADVLSHAQSWVNRMQATRQDPGSQSP